jgi:hypothetical protein
MSDLNTFPEWLGTALIGAVIAALGYVSKLLIDAWTAWRHTRSARLSKLLKMSSLLHSSYTAFLIQREHVDRLWGMIQNNHPDHRADRPGFERHFTRLFDQFTPEEAELHGIIRSITEHTLHPLNQQMSEWLGADIDFRTARGAEGKRGQLANQLNLLDSHLLLWLAKYQAWIPADRRHALVYLADEERHGIGFPRGIEHLVDDRIKDLGGSVPDNKA